jgi:hypothetical protein
MESDGGIQIAVDPQHRNKPEITAGYLVAHDAKAAARGEQAAYWVVAGQAKRCGKRLTRLETDSCQVGYPRHNIICVSGPRIKDDSVIRKSRAQRPQILLIEREMHIFVADEIEEEYFAGNDGH